jgi:hypothetical protein
MIYFHSFWFFFIIIRNRNQGWYEHEFGRKGAAHLQIDKILKPEQFASIQLSTLGPTIFKVSACLTRDLPY